MKGIFVLWGSAPALAIATVLILNILSGAMHEERGEEAVSIDVGKGRGSTGEVEEQHAKAGDVGISSEPEESERMLVQEPSMQMAPVREAQVQGQEQYLMLVLPYLTSIVAASLSFMIVRRFVYK